jgi:hypothetical protein
MTRRLAITLAAVLTVTLSSPPDTVARTGTPPPSSKTKNDALRRVLVLTGENVHNVGELHMHVGNWGMFGSWPGSGQQFSEAPSAQWPAGSGVEYLFQAGLWVGAMKGGVPAVSTATTPQAPVEIELRPTQDPVDIIYQAAEGAMGGKRPPSLGADDDDDGAVDEDWLNGHDDDMDGLVDEDFAAVSKQMFSCWYTDDQASAITLYPEHNPLNIMVRQESYQWEEDRFDDFVGINYWITNIGTSALQDIYIGFFADCDAGSRDTENYWDDDATGFHSNPAYCTNLGPVSMDIAYTYDADGDEGNTTGYFGVLFLGHSTDVNGEMAPEHVGVNAYANFSGGQTFDEGGDPTTDFERYTLLSTPMKERNNTAPRDYRMLVSAGPFNELLPGSTLVFQVAFVIGNGLRGMETNAAAAQLTFNGAWFDLDQDMFTGVAGRETPIPGPVTGVVVDSCKEETRTPRDWNFKEPIWINNDCAEEELAKERCGFTYADSAMFMTGVGGAETQIFWIVGTAPPPPALRIDDRSGIGVVLYWDNFSETVPDVKTLEADFEGYRVWRADNWARPLGTSVDNGPAHELWKLLFQADIVNNFGEDTGLNRYRYEPLVPHILSAARRDDLVRSMVEFMTEFPDGDPPCPPGVTEAVCETLGTLAEWEIGRPGGRRYYRYVDKSVHLGRPYFYAVTALDHAKDPNGNLVQGKIGDPSSNFAFVEPRTRAQKDYTYDANEVYVVPNPATTETMAPWTLSPNNDDPTGIKVEFRNLPWAGGTIRVYTLAGDLVSELPFDGATGNGTVEWDLVSRNGQDVTSGIYLFSVEADGFDRKIGKFVVIR